MMTGPPSYNQPLDTRYAGNPLGRCPVLFDIGIVIACHFITANLALLSREQPPSRSRAVRVGALMTIGVGLLALVDLVVRRLLHLA